MKLLRTLPTRTLIAVLAVVVILAAGGTALGLAARGGGPKPAPKPLDRAIHDAIAAPAPKGVSARIRFVNKLFPSGAILGNVGSALMSGASGRLWVTNDGRGRIELQSDAGDVQIVWNGSAVAVYDASAHTVYRATLPRGKPTAGESAHKGAAPTLAEIDSFLSRIGAHATISGARPTDVAGRPAYSVSLSPKHDGGLLASARLAWDAVRGVPLRIGIYAQGSKSPVLELAVTSISYGSIPASDVDVQPPSDARVVNLSRPAAGRSYHGNGAPVTGLARVRAAARFPVAAPAKLVGLPRRDVRLVGGADSKTALVFYGHGLGGLVVVERPAGSSGGPSGALTGLPKISLNGVTAHELATQLGTVVAWQRGHTAYVLAGSLPPAAAETAARQLR